MAQIITVKVSPRASKHAWTVDAQGTIKVSVTSAPERGKANKEIIESLAKKLRVPQSAIEILTGETSKQKRIKIDVELSREEIYARLGLGLQGAL